MPPSRWHLRFSGDNGRMTPDELRQLLQEAQSLHRAGRLGEAERSYLRLAESAPPSAELWHLLGVVAFQGGNASTAIERYRKALALKADFLQAQNNLGVALKAAGRFDEAQAAFSAALLRSPDYAEALGNFALLCIEQGRLPEARSFAERAAALSPGMARWHQAAGTAARHMKDFDAAATHLARASSLAPGDAAIAFELGLALEACADEEGARAAFKQAARIEPAWERLRWSEAMLLPRIPRDEHEVAAALQRFDEGLARLDRELRLDSEAQREAALEAASSTVPVNLHYLAGDHTARQIRYGDLVGKAVRAALPDYSKPLQPRAKRERLRVGFVSGHLHRHVVTRCFADFIVKLDPARFERHVWAVSNVHDEVTGEIAAAADRFTPGESALAELARGIRDADLDALVFLDIGIDPHCGALAALRLAPLQVACPGHPVTTGLDSIDCFAGAELMEPPGSEAHYRERLVRLPGLGASIRAGPAPGDGRWADALRAGSRPLAMCLQDLAKIPPAFDAALADILARSGARLVLFNRGARLTERFRVRLDRALDARGVSRASVHVEPVHEHAEFLGGIARADLILDTPNFSGGLTSLDAFAAGAAVVAFDGSIARARQTSAMLRMMEIGELIARDERRYADLAVELLADRARLEALRARVRANSARLFGDRRPIAGLQELLAA